MICNKPATHQTETDLLCAEHASLVKQHRGVSLIFGETKATCKYNEEDADWAVIPEIGEVTVDLED